MFFSLSESLAGKRSAGDFKFSGFIHIPGFLWADDLETQVAASLQSLGHFL